MLSGSPWSQVYRLGLVRGKTLEAPALGHMLQPLTWGLLSCFGQKPQLTLRGYFAFLYCQPVFTSRRILWEEESAGQTPDSHAYYCHVQYARFCIHRAEAKIAEWCKWPWCSSASLVIWKAKLTCNFHMTVSVWKSRFINDIPWQGTSSVFLAVLRPVAGIVIAFGLFSSGQLLIYCKDTIIIKNLRTLSFLGKFCISNLAVL